MPIAPPAPARFSTIICSPRASPSFSATMRPITSTEAPGALGMIILIGLRG